MDVPNPWPAGVKCEMNLPLWEVLMQRAGLHEDIDYIVSGFRSGFCQGIPQHTLGELRWYTPPNQKSARDVVEQINNSLKKELEEGRAMGPYTHEELHARFGFFRSNPMGSTVNGDGFFRLINDLSFPHNDPTIQSVNSFVDKNNYETTWDDFDVTATFFTTNPGPWLLSIFDWAKAYRQVPTHPSQWKFLCIMDFDNHLYIDTQVGFGGVAGCGVFGAPAETWKSILESVLKVRKIMRWVDDNLIFKRPEDALTLQAIERISDDMGVKTNTKKNHDFDWEQRYIGFIWNGENHTVRLPADKLAKRTQHVTDLLSPGGKWSHSEVEKIVGRLSHTCHVVPHMKCYMNALYWWLSSWVNKSATQSLPQDVREDLHEWRYCLENFKSRMLIPSPKPQEVHWVGDAASSFGIGVLIGKSWSCFKLKPKWRDAGEGRAPRSIAWAELVAIRLGLLTLSKTRQVAGKNFIVATDNNTSKAAILNRKSRDWSVNEEWKKIQKLLTLLQCDLTVVRVQSEDNAADALSRGVLGNLLLNERIVITTPGALLPSIEQTTPPC